MSQINTFYINKPKNFTQLTTFKLYLFSLVKIFAKYETKLILTVIDNSNYITNKDIQLIAKNIGNIEDRHVTVIFDVKISSDVVSNNIENAFLNYKNPETILDTFLSYEYSVFTKFIYKITSHFLDLISSFKKYESYDKKFMNKMNILQQLTYKQTKFIVLNIDTYNNIIMPDMYYIKALALIFKTLSLSITDMINIKIIITYDNKIDDKAYDLITKNLAKHLKTININNFISYKEINKFYSQFDSEEFIFYLNMFHFPTICSQNPESLIPVFLKENHKTLDWDLYNMSVFSKKLFAKTLISRSFGI